MTAAMAMMSQAAFSQQAMETAPPALEEIVVTGSRIARDPNLASPVPVQLVTSEDFKLSGQPNIADVLNRVPALIGSTSAEASLTGTNVLNLRGLGDRRTLTLVNGRRYVGGGTEGSASVDLASIPNALIERVEVLTGGASAVYGSDAVTGVVNFILRDDFEGQELNVRGGISGRGDAESYNIEYLAGLNFADNRGNITFSADLRQDTALRVGDRPWSRDNGIARGQANPALRFQQGDITASDTPLFFEFYNTNEFRFPYGLFIPTSADAFINRYNTINGTSLTAADLTPAERALIERRANAPSRAFLPQPTFSISNAPGIISPFDLDVFHDIDLDGDGVPDCDQSFVGFNNQFYLPSVLGDPAWQTDGIFRFDYAGGCWTRSGNGPLRPYQDGLVAGNFNQFGGDGVPDRYNQDSLYPRSRGVTLNLNGHYDLTDSMRVFAELGYTNAQSRRNVIQNGFFDLLYGSPENPFLPQELLGTSAVAPGPDSFIESFTGITDGGLWITRDPTDSGGARDDVDRETMRGVVGIEGELRNGWVWEVVGNVGNFDRKDDFNSIILDRFFAAIDVVTDPETGAPVCRSDLDPTAIPFSTIFGIPEFNEGIFSFTPGDGQCRPANIWGGQNSISPEAAAFFNPMLRDEFKYRQRVFSTQLVGDTADFMNLPAGPISFAAGAEYRSEKATSLRDPLLQGILPPGSPFPAGTNVADVSDNNSLGFNALFLYRDSSGSINSREAVLEVAVPLLADQPFAQELTVDAAWRVAKYNSIGTVDAWKVGLLWTPVSDLSFRGTLSQAVRAPNLRETFITNPAVFRPVDPCDSAEISNAPDPALRAANCQAGALGAGLPLPPLPADFNDPLSARFGGVLGGNPELEEETADTVTVGFVLQPSFLPGFSLTVDYWDVKIKDGIEAITAQETVDTCYDASDFPDNVFCTLFTRETSETSAQFGGFRFLNQTFVNFAQLRARGYDFSANYAFALGGNDFRVSLVGAKQEKLDRFTNRADPSVVDPRVTQLRNPKWNGQVALDWTRGQVSAGWRTLYQSRQSLEFGDVEQTLALYGPAGFVGSSVVHNFNASYWFNDDFRMYGGVNNVADKDPFATTASWPVSPRGRYFFLGMQANF
ncbi:MAG: TonB-dependent receptor [Gammaproteobacteria bacterium]|nr:TonB-dependent receptor [Gammaproteobacteria bacterium]